MSLLDDVVGAWRRYSSTATLGLASTRGELSIVVWGRIASAHSHPLKRLFITRAWSMEDY